MTMSNELQKLAEHVRDVVQALPDKPSQAVLVCIFVMEHLRCRGGLDSERVGNTLHAMACLNELAYRTVGLTIAEVLAEELHDEDERTEEKLADAAMLIRMFGGIPKVVSDE